jgi:hypothetical protein
MKRDDPLCRVRIEFGCGESGREPTVGEAFVGTPPEVAARERVIADYLRYCQSLGGRHVGQWQES